MTSFSDTAQDQAQALADYLIAERETILLAWGRVVDDDSALATASRLNRAQFRDHIPEVLDYFDNQLRQLPTEPAKTPEQDEAEQASVSEHGLHRWQQGYDLGEVIREWGHLHVCLVHAINAHSLSLPAPEPFVVAQARLLLAILLNEGVWESVTEYDRLRQAEAAGRLRDLEQTLAAATEAERQRGEDLRVAAHDLRGSLTILDSSAQVLQLRRAAEPKTAEIIDLLQTGVNSLHHMLNDLMDLARLEAGHERRVVAPFDAATLIRNLCDTAQPIADQRGLFLHADGPATLPVEGDALKVQRITQNLLLNALRYTPKGGVSVIWAEHDPERWLLAVRDTGPGYRTRSSAPIAEDLNNATEIVQETEHKNETTTGDSASNPMSRPGVAVPDQYQLAPAGEGVGLSIVKRLCELLDASLELETTIGAGATFRVLLPRQYGTTTPLSPELDP